MMLECNPVIRGRQEAAGKPAHAKMPDWPHSPVHRLEQPGAYIVTAGTYLKQPFFASAERLDLLCDTMLLLAEEYAWQLQAWAVFANHYHWVALSPANPESLVQYLRHLHSVTAAELNRLDATPTRKFWYRYWDTHLTYQKSYFARLSYVHHNAVHHGLALTPSAYRWCSADWFERRASRAFLKTVTSFRYDQVQVPDDFSVQSPIASPG